MIAIDADIPRVKKCQSIQLYPFGEMKVDDSFFTAGDAYNVRRAASRYGKRYGLKFSVRKVTEKGRHGYRIWRDK